MLHNDAKMDEASQNDIINTVVEQAIAADDSDTTAKLLSAANVLIDSQTDES